MVSMNCASTKGSEIIQNCSAKIEKTVVSLYLSTSFLAFVFFHDSRRSRVQDTRIRMPNKWHICKEGQAGNKKRQLLVSSELPRLPSAGSRPKLPQERTFPPAKLIERIEN
jgi:hypothetical protein